MPKPARESRYAVRPWQLALGVAVPLALAYLIARPPAGDLAAATYRSDLFARVGLSAWDTGWYAAHGYWLPSYSLLSPALGALLGVRVLLALSALAASLLFALLAERTLAARLAAPVFALGIGVGMLSGRVPYDLGVAIGLGAALALLCGKLPLALALAVLTAAASPVAGAFLALAGLAGALGATLAHDASPSADAPASVRAGGARDCLLLAAAALAPVLALALAYPNGGYEPFAASAFWPALAAVAATALLLPRGPLTPRAHAAVRAGAGLYALALIAAYAIRTPMGGNAARLGALLAAPLLAGVLWQRNRRALALLALPLLYWQLATPIRDFAQLASDPSTHASYYKPLLAELRHLRAVEPGADDPILEVPLTKAHWEAAYLPWHDGVKLARGWERQLDSRYAALFYGPALSAQAYRAWLAANRVRYVALPDAPLDRAGAKEGALVARGLPYLREIWRAEHWRLYRFMG